MADPGRPPVSVADHVARVLGTVAPLPPVTLPLDRAVGAVLAGDAVAAEALPRFDHAAMDGYAVRAVDVVGASSESPVELPVAGVIAAGAAWDGKLEPGTALRIMTGAAVPAGADAVVPFEWTDAAGVGRRVRISQEAVAGRHIRVAGEDVAAGAVAVPAGTVLAARHLGLLAAVGRGEVVVRPRPRVAVVSTGAELVGGDALGGVELGADAVLDANTVALVAAARQVGADAEGRGPVADDLAVLQQQVERAAERADIVVTTGGVSAGDHDVVKAALRGRVGFWFGSVAVKPGRPQGIGVLTASDGRRVPVVSLPGTPVAAFTSFHLFVVPALRVLASRADVGAGPGLASAVLGAPVAGGGDRTVVLPAAYDDRGRVVQLPGHVGHSQHLLARADALLVMPPGDGLAEGDPVDVVPL